MSTSCGTHTHDTVLNNRIDIYSLLQSKTVDLTQLKNICFKGCSDVPGVRSLCWKYLLNYIPPAIEKRSDRLLSHRNEYASYVREFVVESGDTASFDHPLNSEPSGAWIGFFKDNEVLHQIQKDCRRICPDFDFFHRMTDYPCTKLFTGVSVGVLRRRVDSSILQCQAVRDTTNEIFPTGILRPDESTSGEIGRDCFLDDGREWHWEVIQRILYIFYKTHVAQGYVQGMNEVVAPIYYLFATDPDPAWRRYAEIDTFFCFNNLMTEIHQNFIRHLDDGQLPGLGGQLRLLMHLLAVFDRPLHEHFGRIGLQAAHFGFRWLSLLLAREFSLPDVLCLWDTLLSDLKRFAMLPFVCCSMLILIRDQLLEADFPTVVNILQHYPPTVPITTVLSKAKQLYLNPRLHYWPSQ